MLRQNGSISNIGDGIHPATIRKLGDLGYLKIEVNVSEQRGRSGHSFYAKPRTVVEIYGRPL